MLFFNALIWSTISFMRRINYFFNEDIGHFESERYTKLYWWLSSERKSLNFAICLSEEIQIQLKLLIEYRYRIKCLRQVKEHLEIYNLLTLGLTEMKRKNWTSSRSGRFRDEVAGLKHVLKKNWKWTQVIETAYQRKRMQLTSTKRLSKNTQKQQKSCS
jgi:hypothetical protein